MIIVALGANLPSRFGGPAETIEAAKLKMVEEGLVISRSSRTWLTAPVPVSDQPWYHNAVVSIKTDLDPFQLLSCLQSIENDFGRTRILRNEPRVLDLDLVAYNNQIIDRPALIVPHPRMHERAFVLLPMADIVSAEDSAWIHPVSGAHLDGLIALIPPEQMARPMDV